MHIKVASKQFLICVCSYQPTTNHVVKFLHSNLNYLNISIFRKRSFICTNQHQQRINAVKTSRYLIPKQFLVGIAAKESEKPEVSNDSNGTTDASKIKTSKLPLFHRPSGQIFHIPSVRFQEELKYFNNISPTSSPKSEKYDIQSHLSNIINENIKLNESDRKRLRLVEETEDRELDDNVPKTVNDLLWREVKLDKHNAIKSFLSLSKIRLTSLVVMTSMAGYAMAPGAFDLLTFVACSAGVLFTSAAANSMNQFFEVPYDSQMSRTMNRPIVRGVISPPQAVAFAAATCTTGAVILFTGTNTLTAVLGLSNVMLYSLLYTPMKRINIANTWVGAVVGAIPPIMGWTAATGGLDLGAILMGGVLYAWQFPHFCALSWNLQADYSRAGYRMMSVIDPNLCKRVSLRYSASLICLSFLFPLCDVTTWTFAVDSLPLNLYLTYLAYDFYRRGDSNSSRKLFRYTLIHLPLLLVFMIISKKHYGVVMEGLEGDSDHVVLASSGEDEGVVG